MQKGAIYGLLFPLAQFHLGVAITPVTKAETDVIDPELWIKAFVRGTRTNRDLALNQALLGHQNCIQGANKSRAHEALLRVRPDSSPRHVLMKLLLAGLLLSELTYPRRSAPGGYC
jgi:hypothetical protein